ncbi:hypothetical protein [Kineococcus sp. SYSU DK018]|uniref:hypothetical protein n=1 Tax=Kineococcus sp. SYSU DK018 TaxID=3383139 RepID=UPI003D7D1DA6
MLPLFGDVQVIGVLSAPSAFRHESKIAKLPSWRGSRDDREVGEARSLPGARLAHAAVSNAQLIEDGGR